MAKTEKEFKEINGWLVPNDMTWDEFVSFRISLGLDCKPRKALYRREELKEYDEDFDDT